MMSSETVIVNKSFASSEIHRLLSQLFKIRESDSTITHSLIFPKQSKAFLIQPICEVAKVWPPRGKFFMDDQIIARIEHFQRIHCNAYVFLTSVAITPDEEMIIDRIQTQFFNAKMVLIPCSGAAQCVNIMVDIVKPKIDMVQHVTYAKSLTEEGCLPDDLLVHFLEKKFQLSHHDAMVLQDGCKALCNVMNASVEELKDCSLSLDVASRIYKYVKLES